MSIWAFPSFYPYDHPGMRWQGIFAHRQYKGLVACGADVKVVQPVMWHPGAPFSSLHGDWKTWAQFAYPRERVYDGITVYHPRIANMKPGRVFNKKHTDKYVDAIVGFFKKKQIKLDPAKDIFYAQWVPDAYMVLQAAHILGIKCAVLVVGDDVLIWPNKSDRHLAMFKETMINADMRFSVAGYLAAEANKLVGGNVPFNVIRRGVNYDFFKPVPQEQRIQLKKEFGIPADKTIILTIGTAIVRKGWLDLFDALKEIKKEMNSFVLVGVHGGTPEFNLKEAANSRGLEKNFIDLGEVDPGRMNKLYNTADIFCLASHSEGIANSVVEAMSTGLAVVTTNICGHPELITNGVNGILVPPKNHTILSETLALVIKDSRMREDMGNNARKFIVSEWGDFAHNAAILYKKLCEI